MRRFSPCICQIRSAPQSRQDRFGESCLADGIRRTAALGVFILCSAQLVPAAAGDPTTAAAENFLLHGKSLANLSGGRVWMGTAERTLRSCLVSLGDDRREVIQQQRSLDQLVQQNAQRWEANRQAVAALQSALAQTTTDAPERKQIRQQLKLLESQVVDPEQLAAVRDVRARLIRFINARQTLALKLLAIRRAVPEMEADYHRLAADLEVQAALRALGDGHRLGPLENYLAELRRLDEFERLVFTSWVPFYIQSDRMRIGAILNERTPITFSWDPDDGPTVLTESMLEAAGVELPPDAPAVALLLRPNRPVVGRQMTVPALRFGSLVLRDLPVYVLGPDGEDLGAMIGPGAFTGYDVHVEPARLQITFLPQSP